MKLEVAELEFVTHVGYVTCGSSVGDVQNVLASAPNRRLLYDWWCVFNTRHITSYHIVYTCNTRVNYVI